MVRDQIYSKKINNIKDFVFDDKVASAFDDMLSRSIPFYSEIHCMILDITDRLFTNTGKIYDLGCSTGSTIHAIAHHLNHLKIYPHFVGVDNSPSMIKQCQKKIEQAQIKNVQLHCCDMAKMDLINPQMIIMNYTLQFINPLERQNLLNKIYTSLNEGGIFILSEKIVSHNPAMGELTTDLYYDFKRRNGYSQMEIAQKREALENVLIPTTTEKHIQSLETAGFTQVDQLFRWYNFASFVGVK